MSDELKQLLQGAVRGPDFYLHGSLNTIAEVWCTARLLGAADSLVWNDMVEDGLLLCINEQAIKQQTPEIMRPIQFEFQPPKTKGFIR